MERLDGKFAGSIHRVGDGEEIQPDQFVVFLAKDNAFLPTLRFYREECERIGAGLEQLLAVDRLIGRVELWRQNNPHLWKVPDAEPGEYS